MSHLLPNKGEAKQDFLKRCRAENSMAICSGIWKQARLTAFVDDNIAHLNGDVRFLKADPEAKEKEPRRFSMLGYTGAEINWGWMGRFIIALDGMQSAKEKMPALLEHYRSERVGVIDKTETGESGYIAEGYFSEVTDAAKEVLGLADEEFPWQCSIGVQALQVLEIKEGETYEVNGQTVAGPIDVWLKSEVFEVSFCTFGADDDTAGVSMAGPRKNKEVQMDARLRAWLETVGLSAEATEDEATAFLAKIEGAGIITIPTFEGNPEPGTTTTLNKDGAPSTPAQPPVQLGAQQPGGEQPVIPTADPAPVVQLSAADVLELHANAKCLGLNTEDIDPHINAGLTRAQLNQKLFELAGKKNGPAAMGRVEMGADETDKFRKAAACGLAMRMGVKLGADEKPAPGYEDFRHLTISGHARRCLSRAGVRDVTSLSRKQVADQILRLSAGSHSTSDFNNIFMDATHVRLLKAFRSVPQRWRSLVNIVTLDDLREVYGVALSEASEFHDVLENGEYKELKFREKQESFRPGKKGGVIKLSWEMIVNDNLRVFADIPKKLGGASARTLNNFIWNLFLSNPVMKTDGIPLYDAAHKNVALSASKLESTSLSKARAQFSKQTDIQGEILDIEAQYLVVPPDLEETASVLLRSSSLPTANMSAGVINPNAGKLTPISEPRLSASSTTAWYLVGDPNQVETIDVGFLDGREEPEVFEEESFNTDSISYKARICFGAGFMDHVGFYRNLGL